MKHFGRILQCANVTCCNWSVDIKGDSIVIVLKRMIEIQFQACFHWTLLNREIKGYKSI